VPRVFAFAELVYASRDPEIRALPNKSPARPVLSFQTDSIVVRKGIAVAAALVSLSASKHLVGRCGQG
jgi:hypothetical protein